MFSGIVETCSSIASVRTNQHIRHVRIKKPVGWWLRAGQSIAVDGICSTVAKCTRGSFEVEYMPETIAKTTAGEFENDRIVNLERSLTLKDYVDGHLMQGHIDARGRIVGIIEVGRSKKVVIALPVSLMKHVALHGSVAVNGISLTVAQRGHASFTTALTPYTIQHTNLGDREVGDTVNIEVDLLARYIAAYARSVRVSHNAKKRVRKKRR